MPAGSSGGLRVPTRCDRSTLGSARRAGHRRPGTQSPTCPSRRRCDMFDVQESAPSVGRYGRHRSHVASPAARCGLYPGTRHGRGSDRIDRHPHSPDNDATAGVKSMAVDPCALRPVIGTQHCPSGQRNRVPVAVIPTTNTSGSAIRSSHRALSNSRRRSTGGRGRASWGTK
jgi:hypothetical protein